MPLKCFDVNLVKVAEWGSYIAVDLWTAIKTFFPIVFTAVLSVFLVGRYKTREDHADKRIDELCKDAEEVSRFSERFWSTKLNAKNVEFQLLRTKISISLQKMRDVRAAMGKEFSLSSTREIVQAEQALLRDLTGGEFESPVRPADFDQARIAMASCQSYVTVLRSARIADVRHFKRRR